MVIRHGGMAPHLGPNATIGCLALKKSRVLVIDDGRIVQIKVADFNGMYATPPSRVEAG
jgi:hypothetical protein